MRGRDRAFGDDLNGPVQVSGRPKVNVAAIDSPGNRDSLRIRVRLLR